MDHLNLIDLYKCLNRHQDTDESEKTTPKATEQIIDTVYKSVTRVFGDKDTYIIEYEFKNRETKKVVGKGAKTQDNIPLPRVR